MLQLTEDQIKKLHVIWFTYGNNGRKHSHYNHKFIQNIIEHNEYNEEFYRESAITDEKIKLSDECVNEVKKILLEWN